MEINLVTEGLKFMVLGMVTVFLFLILMVVVLKLQSTILTKLFPVTQAKPTNSAKTQVENSTDDTTLIAVITAAITKFRNQNT